jgi:hypothetical protein
LCREKNKLYTAAASAKSKDVHDFFIDEGERLIIILRGGSCNQICLNDDLILSFASLIAVSQSQIISIVGIDWEESASTVINIQSNHTNAILIICWIVIFS